MELRVGFSATSIETLTDIIIGQDFQFWLLAEWWPCSSLMKAPPPITWSIGSVGANDPRRTGATSLSHIRSFYHLPKAGQVTDGGRSCQF